MLTYGQINKTEYRYFSHNTDTEKPFRDKQFKQIQDLNRKKKQIRDFTD